MSEQDPSADDRRERLDDARRRLREHPAFAAHREWEGLARTITAVFEPNLAELLSLLDAAATNWQLATELVQNVHRPDVRDTFHALTAQRLHNYVAGTMTVIEHVRRIRRDRQGLIYQEFDHRLLEFNKHGVNHFVKDLRTYTQHYELPILAHSLSLPGGGTFEGMVSEVQLSVEALSEWDGWTARSRRYLEDQGKAVVVRPAIREHASHVLRLNRWFLDQLGLANKEGLSELNEIVVEINAAITGGTLDQAREHTRRMSEMRSAPGPVAPDPAA